MYQFKWPLCKKNIAMLVLVWCYKARGDREQDLWRYWLPEGCIKKRYYKSAGEGCLSKKCELREQWKNHIAVSHTLAEHCDIQSEYKIRNVMIITTVILLFVSVLLYWSPILVSQHGTWTSRNIWAIIAILFNEEYMW